MVLAIADMSVALPFGGIESGTEMAVERERELGIRNGFVINENGSGHTPDRDAPSLDAPASRNTMPAARNLLSRDVGTFRLAFPRSAPENPRHDALRRVYLTGRNACRYVSTQSVGTRINPVHRPHHRHLCLFRFLLFDSCIPAPSPIFARAGHPLAFSFLRIAESLPDRQGTPARRPGMPAFPVCRLRAPESRVEE